MTEYRRSPQIRPSQVTRTFGPGAIYDDQHDSMLIMGLDSWTRQKFSPVREPLLLMGIREWGFEGIDELVSVSVLKDDPGDAGRVPVRSFPTWGFCPKCSRLVPGRNYKTGSGLTCNSYECKSRRDKDGTEVPRTYPVRFVAACVNGHLDDFPWYEWVHRTKPERAACGRDDARLYLVDNSRSLHLESKSVTCRSEGCIAGMRGMENALSEGGLAFMGGCTRKRPWLDADDEKCEDADGNPVRMRGVFKGSTNIYFPLVRSAVTIPPFSDRLSRLISGIWDLVEKHRSEHYFDDLLAKELELKTDERPAGRWSLEDARSKIREMEEFQKKKVGVHRLEFNALSSVRNEDDDEFVTETVDVPAAFSEFISGATAVKKMRVVSALTGFTRLEPYRGERTKISRLSSSRLSWLPVSENRGEGVFLKFNGRSLGEWSAGASVRARFGEIMTVQGRDHTDGDDYRHVPDYVFLHTFSHVIMRGIARAAGYAVSSMTERVYCGGGMAGILIFTSSPSSDGAMGGLAEIAGGRGLWNVMDDAIRGSSVCSCDPLCSLQELEKVPRLLGAACHACALLPETCCENMNLLLDRNMVYRTLKNDDVGFVRF